MKKYFITGTDTGVGKTITSAALALALNSHYWKPIQSGIADEMADCDYIKKLTDLPASHFHPSSYSLKASLSPDQAAALENITIDITQCSMPKITNHLIVEGAGGVFVPLNDHHHMLNLMKNLKLPIVVVTRGTLGTINHTLLTLEALKQNDLEIHGIVISGTLNIKNQIAIEKWGKINTLLHIPFFNSLTPQVLQRWVRDHQSIILEKFA